MWGLFFVVFWFGCLGGEVGVGLHYFHIFMLEGYVTNGLVRGSSFFFLFSFFFFVSPLSFSFSCIYGLPCFQRYSRNEPARGHPKFYVFFFLFFADIVLCN